MSNEVKMGSGGQGGQAGRGGAGGSGVCGAPGGAGGDGAPGGAWIAVTAGGTPLNQSKHKSDWDPIKEFALAITCSLLIAAAVVGIVSFVSALMSSKSCSAYASRLQVNADWSLWLGCTVQLDDGTVLTRKAHQQMLSNRHRVTLEVQ